MLTRLIYGARVTLVIASVSIFLGAFIGVVVGASAGYFRGKPDAALSRVVDSMLAIPPIFIGLVLAASRGPGALSVIIAVSAVLWARFARVIRSDVVSLRERDYIAQARVTGCTWGRIMAKHIFPNIASTAMVLVTINTGYVILLESTLSFLGAGVPPPDPSWGAMISEGREYLRVAWWVSIVPGIAIGLTVLALNSFGDWLRDHLDPQLRDSR